MAHQDLRLIGSALLLNRFTNAELARASAVNKNTVRSWVQRNKDHFIAEELESSGERGRPKRLWRLKRESAQFFQSRLRQLDIEAFAESAEKSSRRSLVRVEIQWEAWKLSKRLDCSTQEVEFDTLRQLIRLAWEDYSAVYDVTGVVGSVELRTLAEYERDAGIGEIFEGNHLRDLAMWLASNITRMLQRTVADRFACHVLRMRSDVRSEALQTKVIAAALAARVWADEGLTDAGAPADGVNACPGIAELAGLNRTLEELTHAIGYGRRMCCTTAEDAQAVVCGLTALPVFARTRDVSRWLFALRATNFWRHELAPVALHGLWEARDMHRQRLLEVMAEGIRRAKKPARIGTLRGRALEFGDRAVNANEAHPGNDPNSADYDTWTTVFNYRPTAAEDCQS